MSTPEELLVDLSCRLQVLQLLESSEGPELVRLRSHLNPLEHLAKLPRAVSGRMATLEPRQLIVDPVETHAIASIVAAAGSKRHFATRERLAYDLGNFADAIVLRVLADVKNLAAYRFLWRNEGSIDGL